MLNVLGDPVYLIKYYETVCRFVRRDIVSDLGIRIEDPILVINNDFVRLVG
jgi:hypothetical protein